jgi:hypothetical protein
LHLVCHVKKSKFELSESALGTGDVPPAGGTVYQFGLSDYAVFAGVVRDASGQPVPGVGFTGRIEDQEGAPVPNATVELGLVQTMDMGFVVHHRTEKLGPPEYDGRGSFTLRGLPQGGDTNIVVRLGLAAP